MVIAGTFKDLILTPMLTCALLKFLGAVCHHMLWGLANPTFPFSTIVGIEYFKCCLKVILILLLGGLNL